MLCWTHMHAHADLVSIGVGATCIIAIFGGLIASVAGPCARAITLNVNTPETRGVALAFATTTDDLGKGLGPAFVSVFIHAMGRRDAFNLAVAGWVPCAGLMAGLTLCIRKDEDAMQVSTGMHACLCRGAWQDAGLQG